MCSATAGRRRAGGAPRGNGGAREEVRGGRRGARATAATARARTPSLPPSNPTTLLPGALVAAAAMMDPSEAVTAIAVAGEDVEELKKAIADAAFLDGLPGHARQRLRGA